VVAPQDDERLEAVRARIERDRWAGGTILRGELPRVPTVVNLPTASADMAYARAVLPGDGATTSDVEYVCLRDSSGVWGWRVSATG